MTSTDPSGDTEDAEDAEDAETDSEFVICASCGPKAATSWSFCRSCQSSLEDARPPEEGLEKLGAEAALDIGARRGIDLATTVGANLHVVSVVDAREDESGQASNTQTERERQLEEEAQQAVNSAAGLARTHLSGRITTAIE